MKKKLKLMPVIMALLTISCTVWAQAGTSQVTYTINGGKFHNQSISFSANPKATSSGAGAHNGYLLIFIDDGAGDDAAALHALVLSFDKAGTGTANVNKPIANAASEDKDAVVAFGLDNPSTPHIGWSKRNPKDTPGTITITKFGKIGEPVEGTFEGTVVDAANVKYTISGGHFKTIRRV